MKTEQDELFEAKQLARFIRALSEIQYCIGIQIEGDYYEGMS